MISSCCTLRLKRRRAFSRDSPSCSRISAKQTHPQTRPEGPNSYYKDFTGSQGGVHKTLQKVGGNIDQNPIRLSQKRENYAKACWVFWAETLWGTTLTKLYKL